MNLQLNDDQGIMTFVVRYRRTRALRDEPGAIDVVQVSGWVRWRGSAVQANGASIDGEGWVNHFGPCTVI